MTYGKYSSDFREFIVLRPDTPTPWINYLSNSNYCAMISNTAGGYSFHQDPRDRRILRYRYNNLPFDRPGRYIYLRNSTTKEYWSPTWQPCQISLDSYECRHGLGYSIISSTYKQISSQITYFVPSNDACELWIVSIQNNSSTPQTIDVFTYAEFCLWRALSDQNDLQYIQNVAVANMEDNIIFYSLFDLSTDYAFFSSSEHIVGYDCDRETFIGRYNSESNPIAVINGNCSNSHALGGNPIAAMCNRIFLYPNEQKRIIFILGVSKDKNEARRIILKYFKQTSPEREMKLIKENWNILLEKFQVKTPDPLFNLMMNIWNPYQCKTTFDWSRYVSFYETGIGRGMGFRDSSQDSLTINYALPSQVRQRLLDLLINQFEEGKVYHVYFPLTKKGEFPDYTNPVMQYFSDDHLWIVLAICDYLKRTEDFSILSEVVPFIEGSTASVYDHMKRAVNFTNSHLGPHGFPLQGTADWNDTLNLPGPNHTGESVWTAMLFHKALQDLIDLTKQLQKHDEMEKFHLLANEMKKTINETAWDGEWYIRAFTDSGDLVGSRTCNEGQIFLNTQTWAIISGVAPKERAIKIMDIVYSRLRTKYGILLFDPPYSHYYPELGEISTFPPGLKENASIFCHTNPWAVIAEIILGNSDRAFEYWKLISPPSKVKIAHVHKTEPYIYSQMITGRSHPNFGAAKNSWLTGTAAWNLKAGMEWILGIRPLYEGLLIDPCIPSVWPNVHLIHDYKGDILEINVDNPHNISHGVGTVRIDGVEHENNIIPHFGDGKKHHIQVIMN